MNNTNSQKNFRYRTYLQENGIKMKHEAEKINCKQSTFSHKLNGTGSSFSISEVLVIARSHGTTIEHLFGDEV